MVYLGGMQEIIGGAKILRFFEGAMAAGTLHHAFLFAGPEHVGKTTLILRLMARLLNQDEANLGRHPDVMRVGFETDEKTGKIATAISVEQIRFVCERLSMHAFSGGPKVVFIEEAGAMTLSAANALLKVLEEPHGQTFFFLRVRGAEDVLQTIRSRAQLVRCLPVAPEELAKALEARGASKEEALAMAASAGGCPGTALLLLAKDAAALSAQDEEHRCLETLAAPLRKQWAEAAAHPEEMLRSGESVLRDVLLASVGSSTHLRSPDAALVESVAATRPATTWMRAMDAFFESKKAVASHVQSSFAMEHFFLSL